MRDAVTVPAGTRPQRSEPALFGYAAHGGLSGLLSGGPLPEPVRVAVPPVTRR
ncbi:MAG: hypothetical protein M3Z75_15755 [Actinomycetota bacterium]|nr:hypothetical protein [Actinomycetota bacterium]